MKFRSIAQFGFALILAACDTSSTQVAGGTTSETQSSLQALADNIQMPLKTGLEGTSATAAARIGADTTSQELAWINSRFLQFEALSWNAVEWHWWGGFRKPNVLWQSCRFGPATELDGSPKIPGIGGYMEVKVAESDLDSSGVLRRCTGTLYRNEGSYGMTDGDYTCSFLYPTGFSLEQRFHTNPPEGNELGNSQSVFSRRIVTFGDERYQFPIEEPVMRHDSTTGISTGFSCNPIRDRLHANASIGSYCIYNAMDMQGRLNETIRILDKDGVWIKPQRTTSSLPADSMGLRVLDWTLGNDSLRMHLRVQAPAASNLARPLNRIVCTGLFSKDLDSLAVEQGIPIEWSIPKPTNDTLLIEFQRLYPVGSSVYPGLWLSSDSRQWGLVSRARIVLSKQ